jgi:hypothetical protein
LYEDIRGERYWGPDQFLVALSFALEVSSAENLISTLDYVLFHMKSVLDENGTIGTLCLEHRGDDDRRLDNILAHTGPSLMYYADEYAAAFGEQLNVVSRDLMWM